MALLVFASNQTSLRIANILRWVMHKTKNWKKCGTTHGSFEIDCQGAVNWSNILCYKQVSLTTKFRTKNGYQNTSKKVRGTQRTNVSNYLKRCFVCFQNVSWLLKEIFAQANKSKSQKNLGNGGLFTNFQAAVRLPNMLADLPLHFKRYIWHICPTENKTLRLPFGTDIPSKWSVGCSC